MCVEERGSMQYVVRGRTVEERQCLCVRGGGEEYFLGIILPGVNECNRRQRDIGEIGHL